MPKFTKIPANTFDELQVNVGVLVKDFDPATGVLDEADIITATSGGITINVKPTYEDFGSDIDNCPKNTKELKRKTEIDVNVSTTALNINKDTLKLSLAAADERDADGAIVTRTDLKLTDFATIWWIGDLSNGGYLAVKLIDALSTDGFSLKTNDKGKGNVSLGLTSHMSINSQDTEPVEFYIGEPDDADLFIRLNKTIATVEAGADITLVASATDGATIVWDTTDSDVATVVSGVVTGVAAGVCVITAKATKSGEAAIATCNITVTPAEQGEG